MPLFRATRLRFNDLSHAQHGNKLLPSVVQDTSDYLGVDIINNNSRNAS
jgi:hypothetical protein